MIKYLIVRKKNNRICSISDNENIVDDKLLLQVEHDLTQEEYDKLESTNAGYYKDGKIVFNEFGTKIRKEKLKKIKDKINNATSVNSMKKEIIDLINLIK
jgi:Sec7-like guanine-nucleotide exchange factor